MPSTRFGARRSQGSAFHLRPAVALTSRRWQLPRLCPAPQRNWLSGGLSRPGAAALFRRKAPTYRNSLLARSGTCTSAWSWSWRTVGTLPKSSPTTSAANATSRRTSAPSRAPGRDLRPHARPRAQRLALLCPNLQRAGSSPSTQHPPPRCVEAARRGPPQARRSHRPPGAAARRCRPQVRELLSLAGRGGQDRRL